MLLEELVRHSAKGSVWKKHKYLKKIDGTYYYPDSYEGGRHLSDLEQNTGGGGAEDEKEDNESSEKKTFEWGAEELTDENIEELARLVIRGEFGNGQTRKDLLGEDYQRIQDRVNDILLTNRSKSEMKESQKKVERFIRSEDNTPLAKALEKSVEKKGKNLSDVLKEAASAAAKIGKDIPTTKRTAERKKR